MIWLKENRLTKGMKYMPDNSLGELVKRAKGNRTLEEYSKDSGIDATTISKMIRGKYVPRKTKVYEDLTSLKAAPQGGVTCEQLLKAAGYSSSYVAGVMAVQSTLAAIGTLPVTALPIVGTVVAGTTIAAEHKKKVKEEREKLNKALGDAQRFAATAIGIIYGNMVGKGIQFRPASKAKNELSEYKLDTYVQIEGEPIDEYIFVYLYLSKTDRGSEIIVENTVKRNVERLVFLKASASRKVSIVINCKEAYDYFLKFKGELSYKGNLSGILVDVDSVCVEREDYISFYAESESDELLRII